MTKRGGKRRVVTKSKRVAVKPKEPLVNAFTASHGDYREDFRPDPAVENQRIQLVKVLLNRGGSAIERWIAEQDSKLFGRPQIEAVRHCQRLWARIDYQSSIIARQLDPANNNGQAEQDAHNELNDYAGRLHRAWWDCFENVVRHEMPAGIAGEQMANNSRTQVEAAKLATAFVASMIAMWRGL